MDYRLDGTKEFSEPPRMLLHVALAMDFHRQAVLFLN